METMIWDRSADLFSISKTDPIWNSFTNTGFDTIKPLVSVYFAYIKLPDLKIVLPLKKLNPKIIKVIAMIVKAPTLVSLLTFLLFVVSYLHKFT